MFLVLVSSKIESTTNARNPRKTRTKTSNARNAFGTFKLLLFSNNVLPRKWDFIKCDGRIMMMVLLIVCVFSLATKSEESIR